MIRNKIKLWISNTPRQLLLPSFYLAVSIGMIWTPLHSLNITFFKREIGQALVNGIDVSQRIQKMSLWGFFYFPLLLAVIFFLFSFLFRRKRVSGKELTFLYHISLVASTILLVSLLNRYRGLSGFDILAAAMVWTVAILLAFRRGEADPESLKWSTFTALSLSVFNVILLRSFGMEIAQRRRDYVILATGYVLLTIFLYEILSRQKGEADRARLRSTATPIYAAPCFLSLFLEICNILNQWNIFVFHKALWGSAIFLFCILIWLTWYHRATGKSIDNDQSKKWQYPLLVLGLAMLACQPSMQITASPELFEMSNHGDAVYGLLKYGEIPIVQNLDAHMLAYELGRILFGTLNQNAFGAIYFEYSLVPLVYILFYLLLRRFLEDDTLALLLILLFPFSQEYCFSYFGMGVLVYLTATYAYRKRTIGAFLTFFSSCVFACLYRMDVGFSMAIAAAIILLLFCLTDKNKKLLLRRYFSMGIAVLFLFVGIWTVLCLSKGVSPLARTLEFLDIMQSNVRWAYSGLGDSSKAIFVIAYLVVPTIVTVIAGLIFFRKSDRRTPQHFIFAMLALSYLLNFPRSLVRHGVGESMWVAVFSMSVLAVACGVYLLKEKNKFIFVASLAGMLFSLQLLCGIPNISGTSLLKAQTDGILNANQYREYSQKVDRVVESDQLKKEYEPLKTFFDATLKDNETFWDYSHQTLLYALTGRKKPMYTDQSPSFLNGEYSQLMYLKEIEKCNCPYAVIRSYNDGFDGVPSSVAEYLTSEYLYSHYKPLCIVGGYQIWAQNNCYESKNVALQKSINMHYQTLSLTQDYASVLTGRQTKVALQSSEIHISSVAADPGVVGFEKNSKLQTAMAAEPYLCMKIDYSSTASGLFQCFYTTKKGENFSEEKSVRIQVDKSGTLRFSIPCSAYTTLRFDIPDGADFTLKNIQYCCQTASAATLSNVTFIDYNYDGLTHSYSVGELPYLWGTCDTAKRQDVLEKIGMDGTVGSAGLDTLTGNYIEVNTTATQAGIGTVHVLRADGSPAILVSFHLHAGKNRYLIRISWDSMWYSGMVNSVNFDSNVQLNGTSINILKGDTNLNGLKTYALQHFSQ
ncbi:hypothetical protein [Caproicibacter fermentans]|uniref:Uncharacterized protein n=1 Tax=Caproicibacter fermentans TaxID=2576756 RepID=A0A7G8TFN2_9FIRM|nr:hypothetical protein [Caproicibacter fermentans]QNK42423.1 hypothetical protein HCR03_09560 [Caproicibacter fermentans]